MTPSNEDPTRGGQDDDALAVASFVSFAADLRGEDRAAYDTLAARDRAFGEDVRAELAARGERTSG